MKTKFLLHHRFKIMGWIFFFPSLIMGSWQLMADLQPEWLNFEVVALLYPKGGSWLPFRVIENNLADEICAVFLLISGILIMFARERDEDELVMKLRLESILWAALVNGLLLLISIIFFYDFTFFYVMIFNLFLLFLLFIVRFHWVLRKFRKEAE